MDVIEKKVSNDNDNDDNDDKGLKSGSLGDCMCVWSIEIAGERFDGSFVVGSVPSHRVSICLRNPCPNPEGTEREPLMKVWNTGSGGGRRADEGSKADLDKGGGGRWDWEGGGCEEVGVIVRKVDVIGREETGEERHETH